MLFPSRSISGKKKKEVGIEQFNSPKIERDAGEGGREGGREAASGEGRRNKGNVGDKDGVCVFVCEREKRQDGERQ